jgi:hypothetical protein
MEPRNVPVFLFGAPQINPETVTKISDNIFLVPPDGIVFACLREPSEEDMVTIKKTVEGMMEAQFQTLDSPEKYMTLDEVKEMLDQEKESGV